MIQFLATDGSPLTEPYAAAPYLGTQIVMEFKVKNVGSTDLENLGFYLEVVTSMDFQSTKDNGEQLAWFLAQGDLGYGITIDSGEGATRFTSSVGASYDSRIELGDGGALAVGEEVTVTVTYDADAILTAEAIGFDLLVS